ncbi:MAG: hypothetical protein KGM47_07385 [Acidobacteriota bacterium]|nr:hypothetical protein [Acidobacteriota bacterium]
MRVGTKSILFGAHSFIVHPFAVFEAWRRLYGFPWDPRLWVAFAVHDLGYVARASMDGAGSEAHVELGAKVMEKLFGRRWGDLCRWHSREWCIRHGQSYSRLCVADKLAFVITPACLYLPLARATGELAEYMAVADGRQAGGKFTDVERSLLQSGDVRLWLVGLKSYSARWVDEHHHECRCTQIVSREIPKKLKLARQDNHRPRPVFGVPSGGGRS